MPCRCFLSLLSCLVLIQASAAEPEPAKANTTEPAIDIREEIVYSKVNDRELLLDAYVPQQAETCPGMLVIHGGAWRSGNRKQLRRYATSLTKMGFVCFAIDYRLAPGHKFPAQIEDCRSAVKWIRENADEYKVDPSKLGAIGYSAGGHLVSLLATTGEAPNEQNGNIDTRIQAGAAGGAPTDFRWFPDNGKWASYWMGGDLDEVPDRFRLASSAAFVDADDAPLFFFNGTNDKLVPLLWTRQCYQALKTAGVKTELFTIDGAGHMQAAADPEALEKAYAFLRRELLGETEGETEGETGGEAK